MFPQQLANGAEGGMHLAQRGVPRSYRFARLMRAIKRCHTEVAVNLPILYVAVREAVA